jgi:hypothetical protein
MKPDWVRSNQEFAMSEKIEDHVLQLGNETFRVLVP